MTTAVTPTPSPPAAVIADDRTVIVQTTRRVFAHTVLYVAAVSAVAAITVNRALQFDSVVLQAVICLGAVVATFGLVRPYLRSLSRLVSIAAHLVNKPNSTRSYVLAAFAYEQCYPVAAAAAWRQAARISEGRGRDRQAWCYRRQAVAALDRTEAYR